MKLNRKNPLLAALITLTLAAPSLHAQNGNWNVNAAGNWSLNTNWNPTVVPGTAAGDIIGLNNDIGANRTVTIDTTSRTAGILNIGDSNNTHGFTLAASGGASLTLNNSGSGAQINETGSVTDAISAPIILADNLTASVGGSLLITGAISETGGAKTLTKTGDGIVFLTNAVGNTWTGGSTISGGIVSFRTAVAVPATGTQAFGANTTLGLAVGAGAFTTAQVNDALLGTAPTANITLASDTRIGIDTGIAVVDFNVSLAASSRGLDKIGSNNLTLSADNSSFDGDIRVVASGAASSLVVTHSNALGSTVGNTTVQGGGGSTGNTLNFSSATTDLTMAEKLNFFGNAAGRARMALANTVALTHTLSGAIDVTSDTNIPEWNSGGGTSLAAFKITGDITGTLSGGATGLLLRGNAHGTASLTPINKIEGDVTLTGGGITKSDSGTWQIGASGKTYKAPNLTVSNGLLLMGAANYLDLATPVRLDMGSASGGTTGNLDLNGFSQTVGGINLLGTSGAKSITSSSGTPVLTVNNAIDYTTGSLVTLTGSLGLTKTGVGNQTLAGVNTYTGPTTISGGTLTIEEGSIASSSNILNNGALVYNLTTNARTYGNAISGTGSLTKTGTNTLTLSGSNSYDGTTTISAGTLSVGLADHLGSAAANLVFDGGTLQVTGTTLTSLASLGRTVAFNAGKTVGLNIADASNTFTVGQVLNQTTGGFTKAGAGRVILNQANTYSGTTSIGAGTLRLANVNAVQNSAEVRMNTSNTVLEFGTNAAFTALPVLIGGYGGATNHTIVSDVATPGNAAVTHALGQANFGNTTFNFTKGANAGAGTAGISLTDLLIGGAGGTTTLNPTTANLTIIGGATSVGVNTGAHTLALSGTGSNNSIGGIIDENLSRSAQNVTKSGDSTWTLSGANAYNGPTAVNSGTLIVNGDQSLATGAVSVAGGATLGGTGTLGGNTTIADTGKLEFTLSTAPGSHNKLELAPGKTLTFTASSTLTITSSGGATTGLYTLVTAPGGITWTTPPTVILPVGWTYSTITGNGGNDLVINITSTGAANNYASWASLNSVTGGPNGDSDNDGVKNLIEYALADGQERGSLTGNTLSFNKRGAPWGTDISYAIETSNDLGLTDPWGPVTPDIDSPTNISFELDNPGDNFGRLNVTQP